MRAGLYKYLNDNMLKRFHFMFICICMMSLFHAGGLLHAQVEMPHSLEVGPHVGPGYMICDINPARHFAQSNLQYGGMVRYNSNFRWAFRLEYTNATLKASDEVIGWRPERGLSVKTVVNDFSMLAEFNFYEYFTGKRSKSFSPYLLGGFSVFHYTPYNKDGIDLRKVTTEEETVKRKGWPWTFPKSSQAGVSMVFGLGLKTSLSKHLCMTLEWRLHETFTDYLDDVSGLYVNEDGTNKPSAFSDPTGKFSEGQQRGDSAHNDWFGIAGVTLSWRFNLPGKDVCKMMK